MTGWLGTIGRCTPLAEEVTSEYACMRGYDCVCLTCLVFERLCCPIEQDSKVRALACFPIIFFLFRGRTCKLDFGNRPMENI